MQKKIDSFFKHSSTQSTPQSACNSDDIFDGIKATNTPEIRIKYTRESIRKSESTSDGLIGEEISEEARENQIAKRSVGFNGKILNKKRKYAQYHLELGQSDFLLHTCKICGFMYAKGDETDDKVHNAFHKNYTHGIPFKGWRRESVIHVPSLTKDRIICVSYSDPPAQRNKVQEVVKMMEIELGDGWLFHEHCKVYLYISSQRVAGCMIVEPINTAHRVLSDSMENAVDGACVKEAISKPKTLQFGDICFQREVCKKGSANRSSEAMDSNLLRSIICEEKATPISCGIRAIWVSPSNRRKHIATYLLDAVRKNFSTDCVLERSQLAFSPPTWAGKALATEYTGTGSFLVYKC